MKVWRVVWMAVLVVAAGAAQEVGKTVEVVDPFLKMTAERVAVPEGVERGGDGVAWGGMWVCAAADGVSGEQTGWN